MQFCRAEQSTDSNDLFSKMQTAIDTSNLKGLNLSKVMDTWVNKKGYPVVTVTNYGEKINIKQERFIDFKNASINDTNYLWQIPINWYQSNSASDIDNTTAKTWLLGESMDIDEKVDRKHWIIFNKKQTGMYSNVNSFLFKIFIFVNKINSFMQTNLKNLQKHILLFFKKLYRLMIISIVTVQN